jgi:hypothetical protein
MFVLQIVIRQAAGVMERIHFLPMIPVAMPMAITEAMRPATSAMDVIAGITLE